MRFEPGRNCWRTGHADRVALIVDGANYFAALREALLAARQQVMMVGWDFDFEIDMLPGHSDEDGNAPDGFPNQVGKFLLSLIERRPDLQLYLLRWSGAALFAPGRAAPAMKLRAFGPDQVHFAADNRHPIGACHHQKVVVIDNSFAFCGGIDATDERWDTSEHLDNDERRRTKSGEISMPWHDATTAIAGPAAAVLGDMARARWHRAKNEDLPAPDATEIWPDSLTPDFTDIEVAIARTAPPLRDAPAITEIEQLYLDSIAAAQETVYLESQYFASDSIFKIIDGRLNEPDGPEFFVINPRAARKYIEDKAMHATRSRMIRRIEANDPRGRFRIYHPVTSGGQDIYVHAKISIIDDWFLRVGSSNIDRRSMGFDTECDMALIATRDADRATIRAFRERLLAEHLDLPETEIGSRLARAGSIAALVEEAETDGKHLRRIRPRRESTVGRILSHTRLFDPRYETGEKRSGFTWRHAIMGAVALAVLALVLL